MTKTSPRRYRLVTRYGKTMAQVEDLNSPNYDMRHRVSIAVTRLMDFADAKAIMERLEAEHQASRQMALAA